MPSFEANSAVFNIRTQDPPPTLLLHGTAETLLYRDEQHAFYNASKPMHYPTMVASAEFLAEVFGLGIYPPALEGYQLWAAGWGTVIRAGTNDFDADGLSNLFEYGVDGNPTNQLDQGTAPVFSRSGTEWVYVHPQRSDDTNITYQVESTHQAQAAGLVGKDPNHMSAAFELLVEPFKHVGALEMLVVSQRPTVEREGLFDVLLHPGA